MLNAPSYVPYGARYYYDLYVLVEKLGGFQEMDKSKWQEVNQSFGVDLKSRAIEMEYNATIN